MVEEVEADNNIDLDHIRGDNAFFQVGETTESVLSNLADLELEVRRGDNSVLPVYDLASGIWCDDPDCRSRRSLKRIVVQTTYLSSSE
jgi:hypothetical protein